MICQLGRLLCLAAGGAMKTHGVSLKTSTDISSSMAEMVAKAVEDANINSDEATLAGVEIMSLVSKGYCDIPQETINTLQKNSKVRENIATAIQNLLNPPQDEPRVDAGLN